MGEFEKKVQEVKEIMDEFYILLSLSLGTNLKLTVENREKPSRCFVTIFNDKNPYIMRTCIYENEIMVVLDKNRFSSGIMFHYKLRNYKKDTSQGQEYKSNGYWHITSNEPEMLRDIISIINKKVKVYNT